MLKWGHENLPNLGLAKISTHHYTMHYLRTIDMLESKSINAIKVGLELL